jgi:hypothetical protein
MTAPEGGTMQRTLLQIVISAVGAAGLLLLISGLLSLASPPAAADSGGGIISNTQPVTISAGSPYTVATVNTIGMLVYGYGSVQIQASIDVTDAQAVTVTPQFSNVPALSCSSVTRWFDAKVYAAYPTGSSLAWGGVVEQLVFAGDGNDGLEIPALGRCFRLQLTFDSVGQTFTPTLYLRTLNRM